MLEKSWAHTFRREIFEKIPEEAFAVLFSKESSRPNAAINVIIGGEILKAGFNWSDEELESELSFNLLVRHGVGLDDMGEEPPTLRTVYNLRRRIKEYAEESGVNLFERVLNQLTEGQLAQLELKSGWQRMDSTQLLSDIARLNRLELVLSVFQKGVKGLSEAEQARWKLLAGEYLRASAQAICYRIKKEEHESHLKRLGELLLKLWEEVGEREAFQAEAGLVARTLAEQYQIEGDEVALRAGEELSGESLQSPHDPEATYRKKRGQGYKGYVANISETCDPENELQLITSVQTAPNTTDDGQLLAQAAEEMSERGIEVEQITVDGGYNGEISDQAAQTHGFVLRPTTIRGGKSGEDKLSWDQYGWHQDEKGTVREMSCPGGQQVKLRPGRNKGWSIARFDRATCEACPFFGKECRVKSYTRKPPTIHVQRKSIRTALQRMGMSPQNFAIRANVEATIRAFKRHFPAGKLPVRGLIRAHMLVCASVVMVNFRRIHRYLLRKQAQDRPISENLGLIPFILRHFYAW